MNKLAESVNIYNKFDFSLFSIKYKIRRIKDNKNSIISFRIY